MCKYSLRKHMELLEEFLGGFEEYRDMDMAKNIIICNQLRDRVNRIREYLSLPIEKPKKESFNQMFKKGVGHIKKDQIHRAKEEISR